MTSAITNKQVSFCGEIESSLVVLSEKNKMIIVERVKTNMKTCFISQLATELRFPLATRTNFDEFLNEKF